VVAARFLLGPSLVRYRVPTASMAPALNRGDTILVNRSAYDSAAPKVGEIVVFRAPRRSQVAGVKLVKRIAAVRPGGALYVLGDNRDSSEDSRHFGTIAPDAVIGRVDVCNALLGLGCHARK
jgi:nickel-type superoxide dismutase maturation protease